MSPAMSPPPTALSGGRVESPLPAIAFRWNTPPSVGRLKGGEVPQLHRPLFSLTKRWQVALHEHADRAMVKEGWPT